MFFKYIRCDFKSNLTMDRDESLVEILHDMGKLVTSARDYNDKFDQIRVGVHGLSCAEAVWGWEEDAAYIGNHSSAAIFAGTNFVKYDSHVSDEIEHAYQDWKEKNGPNRIKLNLKSSIRKIRNSHTGFKYVIEFPTMLQKNRQSGYDRALIREEYFDWSGTATRLPVLPKNLPKDGNEFLPTFRGQVIHVTKMSSGRKWKFGTVVYDPLVGSAKSDQDRPRAGWFPSILCKKATPETLGRVLSSTIELGEGANRLLPPKRWEAGKEGLVTVSSKSEEYKEISQFFIDSVESNKFTVVRIQRIQSSELWRSYAVKRDALQTRNAKRSSRLVNNTNFDGQEQKWLFHATDPGTIPKIVSQGFNRSFAGRNGTRYGKGSYFARDASYSLKYADIDSLGIRRMFLCRVAVGDWCKGHKDQLTPDAKPGSVHEFFDSTVDNVTNPSKFVVYHDAQAYPEYLISFRRISVDP